MTVDHFKRWLRRLSLMGYNMAMLYTEDTYKLPDEPYFGYLRGAYTMEEIKKLDAYAAKLGIENDWLHSDPGALGANTEME